MAPERLDKYVSSESGFTERRGSLPGNVPAATSLGERRLGTGSKVSGSRFLQLHGEVNGRRMRPADDGHSSVKRIPASSHRRVNMGSNTRHKSG